MQVRYGSAQCPANGAEVTFQIGVAEATDYGRPLRYQSAYSVRMQLLGSGPDELSKLESDFIKNLKKPDQDFGLYTDTGGATSVSVTAKNTASGVRVIAISAPEGSGAEFVNRRTLSFTVVCEHHAEDTDRLIVSWTETVTITGTGGPRRNWRFPVNAKPIRQKVTPYSLVRATQTGQAIGYRAKPKPPDPIWPLYRMEEADVKGVTTPKYMGQGKDFIDFGVSWSYTFERGDGPLVGLPKLPPGVIGG